MSKSLTQAPRVLMFTSKPLQGKLVLGAIQNHYPHSTITVIHSFYFNNNPLTYPKQEKWSHYPLIKEPEYGLLPSESWQPYFVNSRKVLQLTTINFETITEDFDLLVYAAEQGKECHYFNVFINKLSLEHMEKEYFLFDSFKEQDIQKSILIPRVERIEAFNYFANQGKVKDYFDYNFNINSQSILSLTNAVANPKQPFLATPISKYMLQCLYFVKEQPGGILEKDLFKAMQDRMLGSPASFYKIVENLLIIQFIEIKIAYYYISEQGYQFIHHLLPVFKDYDLPLTLDSWSKETFSQIKPAIDSYLIKLFKAQKEELDTLDN